MHASKDSMWWGIWKILQIFLETKQGLRILELSQHLNHPKCRSADHDLVSLGAHFPPNVNVPPSKYLEHKWNFLVIKDGYAMPFFHYFQPVDGVFMCGFYSLSIVNTNLTCHLPKCGPNCRKFSRAVSVRSWAFFVCWGSLPPLVLRRLKRMRKKKETSQRRRCGNADMSGSGQRRSAARASASVAVED